MLEEVTQVCKKWVMFDGTDDSASIASVSITSKGRTGRVCVHLLYAVLIRKAFRCVQAV